MKRSNKTSKPRFRKFQFEALEERDMRSVTPNDAASIPSLPDVASTTVLTSTTTAAAAATAGANPSSAYLSPAQLSHAYGLDTYGYYNQSSTGAGQTIAIIESYSATNIQSDLNTFDQKYGLPATSVDIEPKGANYGTEAAWSRETAMDVEWAHATAPGAKIVVYEAKSGSLPDQLAAVDLARANPAVSVISMSFEHPEEVDETNFDYHFTTPANHIPITFVASSGDSGGGAQYPAASPNVLSVGGTTLTLDNGNYYSETAWNTSLGMSTGGASHYEAKPSYQSSITLSSNRMTPDVAFDADPAHSGVNVYQASGGGWTNGGGTSLGAPVWAGMIAIANQGRVAAGHATLGTTVADLYWMDSVDAYDFNDITTGHNDDYSAKAGYDMVTGLGTPNSQWVITDLLKTEYQPSNHIPITTVPILATGPTIVSTSSPTTTTGTATLASSSTLSKPADPMPVDQIFGADVFQGSRSSGATLNSRPLFDFDSLMDSTHDDGGADQMVDSFFHGRSLGHLRG